MMGQEAKLHRGAAFTVDAKAQVTLDAIAAKPADFVGKTVRVGGKVTKVCKKKGCWMALQGTDPKHSARITFKDYGFFVPLDADGKAAVVEGVVEVKQLSEAMRKHLAEDEGTTVDKVPATELRMVATGVELMALGH